MTGIV